MRRRAVRTLGKVGRYAHCCYCDESQVPADLTAVTTLERYRADIPLWCCIDAVACSERMAEQGLGRRDFPSAEEIGEALAALCGGTLVWE